MLSEGILLLGSASSHRGSLVDQHLDTSTQPHELHLQVRSRRVPSSVVADATGCSHVHSEPTTATIGRGVSLADPNRAVAKERAEAAIKRKADRHPSICV
jgi:hypothetical protein